jgi:hypothetical protein
VILCTLLGLAARTWLGWQPGLGVGLLVGFVAASFVPVRGALCAVSRPPADEHAP